MGKKLLLKAGSIGLPPVVPPGGASAAAGGARVGAGPAGERPGDAGSGAAVPAVAATAGVVGSAGMAGTVGSEPPRAKTAPGTMLGFMTAQSAAIQEAEQLRMRLAEFEGAAPARRLDPACVVPSRWANRHERSYDDAAFAELKADIAAAGGNVQAIKVRPLAPGVAAGAGLATAATTAAAGAAAAATAATGVGPSNPPALPSVLPRVLPRVSPPASSPVLPPVLPAAGTTHPPRPGGAVYEIVFGHRRHRACLELGLPVLAVVEELSEQDLFVQMERENRARKDLSAWEQGVMYARALDQGLYPSNRQLALAIGRDLGDVGKALALARLPQVVVEAFASPLDLQFRWAKPLADAQQADPEGLVARAAALRLEPHTLAPRQVFEALLATGATPSMPKGVGPSNPPAATTLERDGRTLAVLSTDARHRTHVRIDVPLDEARRRKLLKLLENLLG